MKEKLLYLCHRIPYPPNKGDKIAAYNILKFLNQHYDVYLGCFIDDPADNDYRDNVRAMCKDAFFVEMNPIVAKLKGLTALVTGEPITVPLYFNQNMQEWANQTIVKNNLDKAFIFSGCMAQYVADDKMSDLNVVMHFVDIDSDKWRQYAEKTKGLMRWIYNREYHTLEKYEKQLADKFSTSCFVTESETAMFRSLVNESTRDKIQTLSNGIDCNYFSPEAEFTLAENYPLKDQNYVVFTGAMDYWANVDAVTWFAEKVWPQIRSAIPDSYFYIVGSSPAKSVLNLGKIPGIIITGRVEDVRPYIFHAKASVAPMQIARGIQNKILEAMSMECPVITTELGIEGIENYPNEGITISSSPEVVINWVTDKLKQDACAVHESRSWLLKNYSWQAQLSPLLGYLGTVNE